MMPRIMAVSDDLNVLSLVKRATAPLGFEVEVFRNSRQAADDLERRKLEALFVKAEMPDLDGFELAARLRASKANSMAPIVMFTSRPSAELMRRGSESGVTTFLGSPFTAQRIQRMVITMVPSILREKRRYMRLPLRVPVSCWSGYRQIDTASVNISEGGMLLELAGKIPIGHEVGLEFEIPQVRARLSLRAQVVRHGEPGSIAVKFVTASDRELQALQNYIRTQIH
jgi:DNA-binding response OmpR family regulator